MKLNKVRMGRIFKDARLEKGMKQPDVIAEVIASGCNLAQSQLSAYEHGRAAPEYTHLFLICSVLSVDINKLMRLCNITKAQSTAWAIEQAAKDVEEAKRIELQKQHDAEELMLTRLEIKKEKTRARQELEVIRQKGIAERRLDRQMKLAAKAKAKAKAKARARARAKVKTVERARVKATKKRVSRGRSLDNEGENK